MGGKIFGVLFVIFALGIGYYISDSGTLGKLVSKTFFGDTSTSTLSGEATSTAITPSVMPPVPAPPPATVPPLQTRDERLDIPVGEIPPGFARDELSQYFHKVRIGVVSRQNPADPRSYSQINLSASFGDAERIAITGWRIYGNRGDVMTVPRGVEVYSPYSSGVERDIALARGEVAYIFSSAGPLGRNIKLNKCVGYLENSLDFTPALPRSCPRDADRADIAHLKGKCQDYILSLGTCAEPDINHRDVINDRECQAYLAERYGYRGCFDRYSGDADFLSREWYVWADELFPDLDERHDRVLLFDREGLLVDLSTY